MLSKTTFKPQLNSKRTNLTQKDNEQYYLTTLFKNRQIRQQTGC